MTKKYLKDARATFASRRRAVQALGSLVGTVILGCGDDSSGESSGGSSESTGGDGSSSGGGVPTTGGDDPTTSGGTGTGDESTGSSSDGSSSGDESSTGEPVDECAGGTTLTPEELLAGIDHIIVLMMENRSFDHYFGARQLVEGPAVDGLTGTRRTRTST
jgi:phospholipase C